jgi:osmotically inducible protein OsmC
MKVLDTIAATNIGGRNGKGKSSDGKVEIQFSLAKALGGKGDGATPEHMFALGYSACFASAMQFVAGQKKIHLPADFSITAKVELCQTDDSKFQLAVELTAKADGIDKAELEELLKISDTVCPYSRAIKGNVDVKLSVA